MKKILVLALSVAALAFAGSKRYSFTLFEPALLGTTMLDPGEYRVQVDDQKAVITNGRYHGEAAVKIESSPNKYPSTSVRFSKADGRMHIQEIHVGGSTTKLVFNE